MLLGLWGCGPSENPRCPSTESCRPLVALLTKRRLGLEVHRHRHGSSPGPFCGFGRALTLSRLPSTWRAIESLPPRAGQSNSDERPSAYPDRLEALALTTIPVRGGGRRRDQPSPRTLRPPRRHRQQRRLRHASHPSRPGMTRISAPSSRPTSGASTTSPRRPSRCCGPRRRYCHAVLVDGRPRRWLCGHRLLSVGQVRDRRVQPGARGPRPRRSASR